MLASPLGGDLGPRHARATAGLRVLKTRGHKRAFLGQLFLLHPDLHIPLKSPGAAADVTCLSKARAQTLPDVRGNLPPLPFNR